MWHISLEHQCHDTATVWCIAWVRFWRCNTAIMSCELGALMSWHCRPAMRQLMYWRHAMRLVLPSTLFTHYYAILPEVSIVYAFVTMMTHGLRSFGMVPMCVFHIRLNCQSSFICWSNGWTRWNVFWKRKRTLPFVCMCVKTAPFMLKQQNKETKII